MEILSKELESEHATINEFNIIIKDIAKIQNIIQQLASSVFNISAGLSKIKDDIRRHREKEHQHPVIINSLMPKRQKSLY